MYWCRLQINWDCKKTSRGTIIRWDGGQSCRRAVTSLWYFYCHFIYLKWNWYGFCVTYLFRFVFQRIASTDSSFHILVDVSTWTVFVAAKSFQIRFHAGPLISLIESVFRISILEPVSISAGILAVFIHNPHRFTQAYQQNGRNNFKGLIKLCIHTHTQPAMTYIYIYLFIYICIHIVVYANEIFNISKHINANGRMVSE
jgi:hypothetical protein